MSVTKPGEMSRAPASMISTPSPISRPGTTPICDLLLEAAPHAHALPLHQPGADEAHHQQGGDGVEHADRLPDLDDDGQLDDRQDDEEEGEQRDHGPHGTPGTVLPMPLDYDRWTSPAQTPTTASPAATGSSNATSGRPAFPGSSSWPSCSRWWSGLIGGYIYTQSGSAKVTLQDPTGPEPVRRGHRPHRPVGAADHHQGPDPVGGGPRRPGGPVDLAGEHPRRGRPSGRGVGHRGRVLRRPELPAHLASPRCGRRPASPVPRSWSATAGRSHRPPCGRGRRTRTWPSW